MSTCYTYNDYTYTTNSKIFFNTLDQCRYPLCCENCFLNSICFIWKICDDFLILGSFQRILWWNCSHSWTHLKWNHTLCFWPYHPSEKFLPHFSGILPPHLSPLMTCLPWSTNSNSQANLPWFPSFTCIHLICTNHAPPPSCSTLPGLGTLALRWVQRKGAYFLMLIYY